MILYHIGSIHQWQESQAQNQILIVFILRSIISLRSESCPIRSKLIKGPLRQCYVIIFLKHVFIIIIIIYIKCGMCWLFTCMANLKNAVTYFLTYVIEKYVVLIWLLNICTCIFSWSVSHYAFLLLLPLLTLLPHFHFIVFLLTSKLISWTEVRALHAHLFPIL